MTHKEGHSETRTRAQMPGLNRLEIPSAQLSVDADMHACNLGSVAIQLIFTV